MNTAPASAVVRRWVFAAVSAAALVVGTAHCSSSSGGGASACDTVCDCVASKNGDRNDCMRQCGQLSAKSTNMKNDCESALSANGFSSCKSTCSAFTREAGGANLSAFCAKCESCVDEPGFDEGFCDPFKSSKGFDVEACKANGDVKQLKNPTLSASQLSTMSCKAFDDAE
jgi:hypothetical protein